MHFMLFLDHRVMGRTSFINAWKRHIPFILTTKPRTNLCWTCQRHSQKIYHSANNSVETKRELLDQHIEHLRVVDMERQVYRDNVIAAKEVVKDNPAQLGQHLPNSREGAMHYSFDFAQQVCSLFVCLFVQSASHVFVFYNTRRADPCINFDWRIVRHMIASKVPLHSTHSPSIFVPFMEHFPFHPINSIARCVPQHCMLVSFNAARQFLQVGTYYMCATASLKIRRQNTLSPC